MHLALLFLTHSDRSVTKILQQMYIMNIRDFKREASFIYLIYIHTGTMDIKKVCTIQIRGKYCEEIKEGTTFILMDGLGRCQDIFRIFLVDQCSNL